MRFFERFFTPHTGNPKSVYSLDKTEIMCFHHARYAVDCWISRDFLDFLRRTDLLIVLTGRLDSFGPVW